MAEEQNKKQPMSVDEALRRLIEFDKTYAYPKKLNSEYLSRGDQYKFSFNTYGIENTDKNIAELLNHIKSAERHRLDNPEADKFYSILAKYVALRGGWGKSLEWDGKGKNPKLAEFTKYIETLSDKKLQAEILQMTIDKVAAVGDRGELTDMLKLYASNENVNFDSMCKLYQDSHDKKLKSALYDEILHKARQDHDFNRDKREVLAAIAKEENDLDARDKEFDFSDTKFMTELRLKSLEQRLTQETETKKQLEQQLANETGIRKQLEQQLAQRDAQIENLSAVIDSMQEDVNSSIKDGNELRQKLSQQTDKTRQLANKTRQLIDATKKLQIGIGSRGIKKMQELATKFQDEIGNEK